jgi:tetratricopeptide (TPR) repeat protein
VLQEAGGRRAKAKELLRRRTNGNGAANGKLNGSEVGYWRQLGALSLLDNTQDALAAYGRAADLAPGDAEAQMLVGVLHLRAGNLAAAESAFRRQIELGNANGASFLRHRGHTMLGDVHAAREEHDAAMAAYAEAQREVKSLLEREPGNAGFKRDLSVTCDRIGDMHVANGRLDAALESYRQSLEIAEALAKLDPQNPSGSTTCRLATTASAKSSIRRATARRRWKASARGWRSPRPSLRAMATTCSGNGTCR